MTDSEIKAPVAVKKKQTVPALVALKDFHIFQPPKFDLKIKKGDDLANVPKIYHQNLKTEGVI